MIKETFKQQIKSSIKDAEIQIYSQDNKHFNAIIITNEFKNKTLIERQQLIYSIISEHILNGKIHALSFKTYTIDEWSLEQTKNHKS